MYQKYVCKVYVSKSAIVVIYVMKKKNFPPLPNVKILPFYLETLVTTNVPSLTYFTKHLTFTCTFTFLLFTWFSKS